MSGDDYLFDPSARPDPEVQRMERALRPLRYAKRGSREEGKTGRIGWGARSYVALAVAAGFFALIAGATWNAVTGKTPSIDSAVHVHGDRLASAIEPGKWLQTDAEAARLHLEGIGVVDVQPATRVRLSATKEQEKLELAQGSIHAKVIAPPRYFVVDTPTAAAVDLGCEYTLSVDEQGTMLHVSWGYVSLEGKSFATTVPAGASCRTRVGKGPGVPSWDDASVAFHRAIDRLESDAGDEAALATLLDEARPRDTLTLYALLPRVDASRRHSVFARLAELAPPPSTVKENESGSYGDWKSAVEATW
jgi:ferric-dicitrate binding protein FerR (iron transport regulator)